MALTLTSVPAGAPATEHLAARVAAAKADDPLAPVTVLVPSNHVGVSMRRALARPHGIVGVQFLTVYRLAELLGSGRLAAAGRRPVSTPIVAAAVRRALADEPGLFADVADHPATETAFVDLHRHLAELPPADLATLAEQSERSASVVAIHRRAARHLAPDWYGEPDLLGAAVEALAVPSPVRDGLGTVIVHLPRRLSPGATEFLRAVASHTTVEVVVAAHGVTGVDLGPALAERFDVALPETTVPERPVVDRIVAASDADDEVRAAVRVVIDAVVDGVPLDRIAMLTTAPDPYDRVIHEQLTAAGIPHNGGTGRPLDESVAGRILLAALGIPSRGWRRSDVFALLGTGPVVHDGRGVPVHQWERASRDAGVVAGLEQWRTRLGAVTRDNGAAALLHFVDHLVDQLDHPVDSDWQHHADRARALLDDLTGGGAARMRWPDDERAAFDLVDSTVERLGHLAAVEPGPIDPDTFLRTLCLELESGAPRLGRFGTGLLTGPLALGVGLDLDLVVVVGMTEGRCPRTPGDDSLVPDIDRAALPPGLLPTTAERIVDDHRLLLDVLAAAGPDGTRVLTWSRGDLRSGGDEVPSRWLVDEVGRRLATRVHASDVVAGPDGPWYDHVASFEDGLRRCVFPSDAAEYDLADLVQHVGAGRPLADHRIADETTFRRADELRRSRWAPAFTRFDGNLATVAHLGLLPDRPLSATALERWVACPHAFFVRDVLGVKPVEKPEDRFDLSPLVRGDIVHKILERLIQLHIEDGAPPSQTALDGIFDDVCAEFEQKGLTGRDLLWRQGQLRIARDLHGFLERDRDRLAARGAKPLGAERHFGRARPFVRTFADGRSIAFSGSVDRVDRCADGTLLVIDYKTGKSSKFQRTVDDPTLGGQRLQLVLYALAMADEFGSEGPIRSDYWFVSEAEEFLPIGYEVGEREIARFDEVVSTIVEEIERGVFPALPDPPTSWNRPYPSCVYCDPDNLGTAERFREYERIHDAPELAALHGLAEWDESTLEGQP